MKKHTKILSLFLALIMIVSCMPITASAATYGDLTYSVSNGEVTITDCSESATVVEIPSAIDGYPVTSIGYQAFRYCESLTSVKIPNSVTNIGGYAFLQCESLATITIPDSVTYIGSYAFLYCKSLTSIMVDENNKKYSNDEDGVLFNKDKTTLIMYPEGNKRKTYVIPNSVTSIGEAAFRNCTSLTNITIPDSVLSIGSYAFTNCISIISIAIPNCVLSIGSYAFIDCISLKSITVDVNNKNYSSDEYGVLFNKDKTILIQYPIGNTRTSYVIPDCVVNIGNSAFAECISLTSVSIPDNITNIGDSAFADCTSLTSITIPDSVTSIGRHAFTECKSLASATIGNSVTSIGEQAFYFCESLTSITIPDSVTNIDRIAFMNCNSLTNITIPNSVTSIGEKAFFFCNSLTSINVDENNKYYSSDENGVLYNKDKTTLIQYPSGSTRDSYVIPDCVINIGNGAFADCISLTSVTITDGVISIGDDAFNYCQSLTSITIPDSVTSIGSHAFYCCAFKDIIIPDSVTSIGDGAFCYCSSLISVTIPNNVTSIGENAFYGCRKLDSITINNLDCNIYDSRDTIYSDATIYGYCGSTAQTYAEKYGRIFRCIESISEVTPPTCTEQGYTTFTCSACGDSYVDDYVDATGHKDSDNDTICDSCDFVFKTNNDDEFNKDNNADNDNTTDNDNEKKCFCACHSDNSFVSFIYKIVRFLRTLFGLNYCRNCDCPYV